MAIACYRYLRFRVFVFSELAEHDTSVTSKMFETHLREIDNTRKERERNYPWQGAVVIIAFYCFSPC